MPVFHTEALKPFSKTSILVVTDVKGLLQVVTFEAFKQDEACKVARDVMDLYPQRQFYIVITDASNSAIKLAKDQPVAATSPPPF